MAAERYYIGMVEAAGAAGTVEFRRQGADGWRENAQGQRIEQSPPTEELDISAYSKVGLIAEADGGTASVAVEVSLGGLWAKLADVPADEALILTDLAFAKLRVVWTDGVGAPDITVAIALGC
jgi:hypothetical protein